MGRSDSDFSFKMVFLSIIIPSQKKDIVKHLQFGQGAGQQNIAVAKIFDSIFDKEFFEFDQIITVAYNGNDRALGQIFNRKLDRGNIKGKDFLKAIAAKIQYSTKETIQHIEDNLKKLLIKQKAEIITSEHIIFKSLSADKIGNTFAKILVQHIIDCAVDDPYLALTMVLLISLYPNPSSKADIFDSLENKISRCLLKINCSNNHDEKTSKYATLINNALLPSEITANIFSFRNKRIKLHGREKTIELLQSWLDKGYVSVCALIGKGGSGKSKLAFHFAVEMEKIKKVKIVWLDRKKQLEKLLDCDDYSYPHPVLFICDYASQYEDQLTVLIDQISRTQTNAKFLILERSEAWYSSILKHNDSIREQAIEKPIILDDLDFSENAYSDIMQDFSDAEYGGKIIPENDQKMIIQRALELSNSKSARCLFLLLLTEAYFRTGFIDYISAEALLHNYIEHSFDIIKSKYDEIIAIRGFRILAYATARNNIEWDNEYPAIQDDLDIILDNQAENRAKLNQLFQQLSESSQNDVVSALKPDLIGEYLFLHEYNKLLKKHRNNWMRTLLSQDYSRHFFAMCLADWPKESRLLSDMISNQAVTTKQCAFCAEVFFYAVREARTEAEQKEYIGRIKAIDHSHTVAVLKQYTEAIQFMFSNAAYETKESCILLLKEVEWLQYHCESDEKWQYLAKANNNTASVYQVMGNYDMALEYHNKALTIRKKTLGIEHPDTAMTYCSMASVYHAIGDYDMALNYHNKALTIFEKNLGTDHLNTAMAYGCIASDYAAVCDYYKALEYYKKELIIYEKLLEKVHPDIIITYNTIIIGREQKKK